MTSFLPNATMTPNSSDYLNHDPVPPLLIRSALPVETADAAWLNHLNGDIMCTEFYRVGEWLVNASANTIRRNEIITQLPPRIVDLLVFFIHHAGEVVSRDAIIEGVWNRAVVTDQAITQSICELRKYLRGGRTGGDLPEYVKTVPKRGYCLIAPVEVAADPGPAPAVSSVDPMEAAPVEAAPAQPSVNAEPAVEPVAEPTAPASGVDETTGFSECPPPVEVTPPSLEDVPVPTRVSAPSESLVEPDVLKSTQNEAGEHETSFLRFIKNFWLNEDRLGFKRSVY